MKSVMEWKLLVKNRKKTEPSCAYNLVKKDKQIKIKKIKNK